MLTDKIVVETIHTNATPHTPCFISKPSGTVGIGFGSRPWYQFYHLIWDSVCNLSAGHWFKRRGKCLRWDMSPASASCCGMKVSLTFPALDLGKRTNKQRTHTWKIIKESYKTNAARIIYEHWSFRPCCTWNIQKQALALAPLFFLRFWAL